MNLPFSYVIQADGCQLQTVSNATMIRVIALLHHFIFRLDVEMQAKLYNLVLNDLISPSKEIITGVEIDTLESKIGTVMGYLQTLNLKETLIWSVILPEFVKSQTLNAFCEEDNDLHQKRPNPELKERLFRRLKNIQGLFPCFSSQPSRQQLYYESSMKFSRISHYDFASSPLSHNQDQYHLEQLTFLVKRNLCVNSLNPVCLHCRNLEEKSSMKNSIDFSRSCSLCLLKGMQKKLLNNNFLKSQSSCTGEPTHLQQPQTSNLSLMLKLASLAHCSLCNDVGSMKSISANNLFLQISSKVSTTEKYGL